MVSAVLVVLVLAALVDGETGDLVTTKVLQLLNRAVMVGAAGDKDSIQMLVGLNGRVPLLLQHLPPQPR